MTTLTVQDRTGNLPAEVTRFIGRRQELAEVRSILERSRLVTLTGVGGVGKTRLALRLAADMRGFFPDGTWLVELSPLREPELLARTVAEALRLPDLLAGEPIDLLADHLAERRTLLILDTCEHLVDACAMLSEVLLRAAPGLRIMATSREPLDVMGEHCVVIHPLDAHAGAVDLFTDRAEAMVPGFALTEANREIVVRLCDRLDGIPLAIELAAVRLRAMSVEQLETRIDDRFRILGMARGARNRHQTLHAAITWSHELCTEEERLLWARLSVFPGGFDLAAVEEVCPDEQVPTVALFDVLSRLVEKSIVLHQADSGRFRMLDTIREYGAERLAELGGGAVFLRRHRDHFLRLAEQAEADAMTPRLAAWLERLNGEHANLRVALDYSLSTPGEEAAGLRLLIALMHYYLPRGLFNEGRSWIRRALQVVPDATPGRGRLCFAAAALAVLQADLDGAAPLIAEAKAIADRTGDGELKAVTLGIESQGLLYAGKIPEARAGLREAHQILDEVGYHSFFATFHLCLEVSHAVFSGELEHSLELAERSIQVSQTTGEQWSYSLSIYARGGANFLLGRPDQALEDARTAMRIKETLGDLFGIAACLDLFAGCAVAFGELQRASTLYGATNALWQSIGLPIQLGPQYQEIRAGLLDAARQIMPDAEIQAHAAVGERLSLKEAIALARGTGTGDMAAAPEARIEEPVREPLTRREREIAELVAEGLSNRQIAEQLTIAKRTADSHIEHILSKLGFTSRTQIAVWVRDRA